MSGKVYRINEIFRSIQGEGIHAGRPAVFIRFAGCNLSCDFCDTDHQPKLEKTLDQIEEAVVNELGVGGGLLVLTGGEPALQVDAGLCQRFCRFELAMETNGTVQLGEGVQVDWLTVSPKPDGVTVLRRADEVKYAIRCGDPLPCRLITAKHYLLSPIFDGLRMVRKNVDWCIDLAKENPPWRVALQIHKLVGVR